ncbi:unknown [Segatella copri CAG:164]|nr:unknown [Segatella copri CAG:164]
MIGKVFKYIRYRNLKNYIHTALKVKSKTNLSLQAVLVRINT